ncbi:DUF4269 domain-containing protein [Hymenobacter sp. BT683]|uniref:DUF4269 domain-containing protein n=1 Tax=Hymenobacter jeongseonensis TaxID=2791027 RepID=A0ABS0IID6_9BACT|nr:DUF4269 domain-containing protein [Hymenobacter jeongseonensis]MBF9238101.1 DUF4269 domain-containing protein [Hymenobacter jeongseonensis]
MLPFQNLAYLQHGTAAQRQAYQVLGALDLMAVLGAYTPRLVGTFPLDLQQPGSDLDLVCEVHDFAPFEALLAAHYGEQAQFAQWRTVRQGLASSVTAFSAHGLLVEVFGQPLPSERQHGYRHLCIEHRLLQAGGAEFRARVQAQRAVGIKTEPAFAIALGLNGPDPYAELLALEGFSEAALRSLVEHGISLRTSN